MLPYPARRDAVLGGSSFLSVLGNTSAVDKLVLSLRRKGEGYFILDGKLKHCLFPIVRDIRTWRLEISPNIAHCTILKDSDLSEPKKKTKRGRR